MPVIKDSSVSLIEPDGETKGSPSASTTPVVESGVSISALLTVLCHKVTRLKGHRALPPGCPSEEEHIQVHPDGLWSYHQFKTLKSHNFVISHI